MADENSKSPVDSSLSKLNEPRSGVQNAIARIASGLSGLAKTSSPKRTMKELYERYPSQLKKHFPTLEEALACEDDALNGNDRAQARLWHAYAEKRITIGQVHIEMGSLPGGATRSADMEVLTPIANDESEYYKNLAYKNGNFDASEFSVSVNLGNRSAYANYVDHKIFKRVAHGDQGATDFRDIFPNPHLKFKADFVKATQNRVSGYGDKKISSFEENIKPDKLHYNSIVYSEAAYRNAESVGKAIEYHYKKVTPQLITCAKAGDYASAVQLTEYYDKSGWPYIKARFFRSDENRVVSNSYHDMSKAREWNRVASYLKPNNGKTVAENNVFLKEFFLSQHSTPEGLYNIGHALLHNSNFRDESRAIDYLKYAANIGNANAARELGEYFENRYTKSNEKSDLATAAFWYATAAVLGHPNGKCRAEWIVKKNPDILADCPSESDIRNPTDVFAMQYPRAVWKIIIPEVEFSYLRDRSVGGHMERLERAVTDINQQVEQFDHAFFTIGRQLEAIKSRKREVGDEQADHEQKIHRALRVNSEINLSIHDEERQKQLSEDRWWKETGTNAAVGMGLLLLTGGTAAGPAALIGALSKGEGREVYNLVSSANPNRAAGYRAVADNEQTYRDEKIAFLVAKKGEVSGLEAQKDQLALELQSLEESNLVKSLKKNQLQTQRLLKGYLRKEILAEGYLNSRELDSYAKAEGLNSIDAFLAHFNGPIGNAITDFCYGCADTKQMHIILAFSDTINNATAVPAERALKKFTERMLKPCIDDYLPNASRIDVIKQIMFEGGEIFDNKPAANMQVVENANAAMATLLDSKFSTVGSQFVDELFAFYLHRHGNKKLYGTRLNDGQVTDINDDKKVSVLSEDAKEAFIDRVKHSYRVGRVDLPQIDNLFVRVCGAEYFKPQSVITYGSKNTFADNPEAPVSYPMVNDVCPAPL